MTTLKYASSLWPKTIFWKTLIIIPVEICVVSFASFYCMVLFWKYSRLRNNAQGNYRRLYREMGSNIALFCCERYLEQRSTALLVFWDRLLKLATVESVWSVSDALFRYLYAALKTGPGNLNPLKSDQSSTVCIPVGWYIMHVNHVQPRTYTLIICTFISCK